MSQKEHRQLSSTSKKHHITQVSKEIHTETKDRKATTNTGSCVLNELIDALIHGSIVDSDLKTDSVS
jgi:hypothetical protein